MTINDFFNVHHALFFFNQHMVVFCHMALDVVITEVT